MLDIRVLRQDGEAIRKALEKRGYELNLEYFNSLDSLRKQLDMKVQDLRSQRNVSAKQVGELIRQGVSKLEAMARVTSSRLAFDAQLKLYGEESARIQNKIDALLMSIPNVPSKEVPAGNDEDDNVEVRQWGTPTELSFTAKDHVDLGEAFSQGHLDFERASKLSGARFAVMSGQLARLHRALIDFMLDTHAVEHGYQELYVPYLVGPEALRGTGQLPKFEEDLFKMEGERELYLIPTAEVPVTNLAADEILEADSMPRRYVCHTPCFRSEAGSHGKDTRGMIRQHQFEKVELVQLVPADQSDQALEDLTGHAEAILQKLGLPYRVVILCGGDLGFSAAKTYDIEVWLPSQGRYREISSCSSFRDYQARRMQARWRNPETGKPELVHTLNGSGLAVGRTLVAILENYQNEDGSVTVPEALRPYMRGLERLS